MDDDFIARYRESPRPEFAQRLKERIEQPMSKQAARSTRQTLLRWSPAIALASLVLALVLILTIPAAGALAQDFLNLFRVKKFTAITIDPSRFQQLDENIDIEALLSDQVQVLKEPGEPQKVANAAQAAQRAGFAVATPKSLDGNTTPTVYVQGEGRVRFTAHIEKLQAIIDALNLDDAQLPAALNGATVTVNTPPVVKLEYSRSRGTVTLMQSPSPEIELPPGVDLAQLGEIGLRAAGMSKDEARRFARAIDWSSTFLVPLPANAAEFWQVDINGASGLFIRPTGNNNSNAPAGSLILWARNGMVYALQGLGPSTDLLEIANSVK